VKSLIRIACGYDSRESVAYHVFCQSVMDRTSVPVAITPMVSGMVKNFDSRRDGTTAFIYSRFLVPYIVGFDGWVMYCDPHMLLRRDLYDLWSLRDESKAVMVVQHDYHTKYKRKLIGTPMECDNADYPRKNWSSMILWNCGHSQNRILTPEFVSQSPGSFLHRFSWLSDDLIGSIPVEWNHLVGEYPLGDASLAHFTYGSPCFAHYRNCDYSGEWHDTLKRATHAIDWAPLIGVA
jgi:hypothetical protein